MKRQNHQIDRREFLRKSIIASAGLLVGAKAVQALAAYEHQNGKLRIKNGVYSGEFTNTPHCTLHYPGEKEEFGGYDIIYGVPPFTKNTKIVSIVQDYKLVNDARPIDSITPVNLEISLHSQNGSDIVINNVENKLAINFPVADWKFGRKPISLWRRHLGEKGEPVGLELLAHIRKAIAKSVDGVARIPLPNLDGVYGSEVPYDFFQLRFDVFPGDLNLDGKGDVQDYAILGNDWKNRNSGEGGLVSDIDGPNGIPDGELDFIDVETILEDRFKDPNDPNTW